MKTAAFHILRVGIAITFIWIGVLILREPEVWGLGYIQPWALNLMRLPVKDAMIFTAILDIVVGFLLLVDVGTWAASLAASFHLMVVLVVSGINEITVRDIGLLAAAVSLFVCTVPSTVVTFVFRKNPETRQ
ncbi:MAG: hypothetical protein A3C80_03765 [Candidatus Ryanbacteria bacterium RIFCSPHIGHO2_02_FULL_45_43]|uniref:DoxX family protein n=1 Tax=Candidatus Ryanbacteria bacterium RIFCSPHIGHO2_01_45_13 TaxID=1802112 RepID=A0A1G2FZY4_9BACT|nr:MAG: hypothetical protein A2718_03025 [Candidatus Ryanbacteria bacterium RIFCSPHIGHO2_01_FULL_44_130]OGZ43131.1 MAG: hypothetical protein A2W41_00350 [Candidatus Ryanbacteria bacterium RIFCSPHIGHO2_01_45_13]OGZ47794.1 MAG: hypothetical protein A3C80_03765 [Candidatus Ryanbacteria bacterium RIFCSPHIGHO2_02_FULL_45_43]OGZ49687.1 MAG: hypothetical protein A3E55_02220 [Candidatus Ryanbacteria bacterium RIFCSPHIGHO2_12_FULL_44_20]OGZ52180.1 MAG: hypothetical protein A3A17_03085 [Candidatus Ryanba